MLVAQVEGLRHAGEVAGSQLLLSQERVEQLKGHATDLERQLQFAKATGLKQEAAIAELLSQHKSNSQSWQEEKQQLQGSATQWRHKAVQLQEEVGDMNTRSAFHIVAVEASHKLDRPSTCSLAQRIAGQKQYSMWRIRQL